MSSGPEFVCLSAYLTSFLQPSVLVLRTWLKPKHSMQLDRSPDLVDTPVSILENAIPACKTLHLCAE